MINSTIYRPRIMLSSLRKGSHIKDTIPLTAAEDAYIAGRWKYPSDHLAVGGIVSVPGKFYKGEVLPLCVGTWNKLNSDYIHHLTRTPWIEGYYAKLEKIPSLEYPGLSKREEDCVHKIQKLMLSGNKSLDVLCIQECSTQIFNVLHRIFTYTSNRDKIDVFKGQSARLSESKDINNHVVTLVRGSAGLTITKVFSKALWQRKYVPNDSKTLENPKGTQTTGMDIWRPALFVEAESISLMGKKEKIMIVNIHVSCAGESDENKIIRCRELSLGLENSNPSKATVIVAGDYNMSDSIIQSTDLNQYKDLSDQHGHIDAKKEEILKIDKILVKSEDPVRTSSCGPISRKELDPQADEIYKTALDPIISSKKKK